MSGDERPEHFKRYSKCRCSPTESNCVAAPIVEVEEGEKSIQYVLNSGKVNTYRHSNPNNDCDYQVPTLKTEVPLELRQTNQTPTKGSFRNSHRIVLPR